MEMKKIAGVPVPTQEQLQQLYVAAAAAEDRHTMREYRYAQQGDQAALLALAMILY